MTLQLLTPKRLIVPIIITIITFTLLIGTTHATSHCISNTNDINTAEGLLWDTSTITRTYTLCPNSIYSIQEYNDATGQYDPNTGSMPPIRLVNANVHIQCGDNGSSANECIFTGGTFQIVFSDGYYYNDNTQVLDNMLIEGVTFMGLEDGSMANIDVYAGSFNARPPTTLTVKDCIFQDNTTPAAIAMKDVGIILNVQDSSFLRNHIKGPLDSVLHIPKSAAVIFSTKAPIVTITNSVFAHNVMDDEYQGSTSYIASIIAVLSYNPSDVPNLVIEDSCFVNNSGMTNAIANTGIGSFDYDAQMNNHAWDNTVINTQYQCDGISKFTGPNVASAICENGSLFTASTCSLTVGTKHPTKSPTASPVIVPLIEPTDGPSEVPSDVPSDVPSGAPVTTVPVAAPPSSAFSIISWDASMILVHFFTMCTIVISIVYM